MTRTRTTIVELDLPTCANTYGVAPCTAELGVTGTKKCFNCIRTCQDRENFNPNTTTLRFCEPTEKVDFYLADGTHRVVLPSMRGLSCTPAVTRPGIDIGMRESVRVRLDDHPHSDAGLDKYLSTRGYDAFTNGSMLWTRLRARFPSLEGAALRVLRGESDTPLDEMTTYNYLVDMYTVQDGSVEIIAKDFLILTDDKNAMAPRLSTGVLRDAIDEDDLTATLDPVGIGDLEYPSAGYAVFSGKESMAFTRAGDVLTITRNQLGSDPIQHEEGASVQLVLHYDGLLPSVIIADLLTNYVPNFDPSWIDTAAWSADVDDYIDRLYSAFIASPTPVVHLLNELIEQVSLIISTDTAAMKIRLQALRAVVATEVIDTDSIMAGSFMTREQPQLRASEVWTYYGQRNPLEDQDEPRNYGVTIATVDPDAEQDYPQSAIRTLFSRWIPSTNRPAVSQLNDTILARYRDPPRQFEFRLFDIERPVPGSAYLLKHWMLVDDEGLPTSVPIQIISSDISDSAMMRIVAEEANFVTAADGGGSGDRYVYIDVAAFNVNLRDLHDAIYTEPDDDTSVIFVINAPVGGVAEVALPSCNVGTWPSGTEVTLIINQPMRGYGGKGGQQLGNPYMVTPVVTLPTNGGVALYTRRPIHVQNNATIAGGGGGGGYLFAFLGFAYAQIQGGGGAGNQPGANGATTGFGDVATPATDTVGGVISNMYLGGSGVPGGDEGEDAYAGTSGSTYFVQPGGVAGSAVDGESYVTYDVLGTVVGPRIN